ncbi:DUF4179 domain-containing protein [Bacillus sp. FJAT-49732]|uniref:DUF4179 domain-containing protein n=1 Tax=Lederbergia citrisecunda TaxID=2833583 RepID=A0A942TS42_9BACI|nr:DUF4179 domain-containing protein [Lederbergia citrisecunda]MBS4201142.1 DUF4179 domain-containing protein [Lederbergia citrisecunda]
MNKISFNVKMENIEVPVDELFSAIDKGIEKGRKRKKYKKNAFKALSIVSMAASLILVSGFIFSPITKVLASVPVIGSIYESLHLNMGKNLEAKNLVTEVNQTVSNNGVNVTLTSVYYDGVYIGITFKTDGESLKGFESKDLYNDYDFYLYEKDGMKYNWTGSGEGLQKVDDYYVSAIEMQYPDKQLPKDFTVPITFTKMGDVEGTWQFDIPVTHLPLKTFTIENNTSQDEKYSFTLESIVLGETNIRLDYTTSIPDDYLNFKIMDDKGNELAEDTHRTHGSESAVFETGIGDTKYLVICPIYRIEGVDTELEPLMVNVQDK